MKVFVTGATGFIGEHLVRNLTARSGEVVCLVRDPARAEKLVKLGARLVKGDVTDKAAVRAGAEGAEVVQHLAGLYKFGPKYLPQMSRVNVDGTRVVLETAAELGVPRILHTSSIAVFGNTRGAVVDESYKGRYEELPSEYERTKWRAHYEVAVPLQQRGAPVIITQPGGVTGAGDTSPAMQVLDYYLNRFPMGMGAQSGITMAHVDDIAEGLALAAERGKPGEAYILAGDCVTYKQQAEMWEQLCGIPAARIWLPSWMVGTLRSGIELSERVGLEMPFAAEALASQMNYTFWGTAEKAKRELGWRSRPLADTYREVLEYEIKRRGIKRP